LTINSPSTIHGEYFAGDARFGSTNNVSGLVEAPLDAMSSTLGCNNPIAHTTSAPIALLDRGTCNFTVKVKNAQMAGYLAAIIVHDMAGSPPGPMAGADSSITIPSIRVTLDTGAAIRTALSSGQVSATIHFLTGQLKGADATGHALLYTPDRLAVGSSVVHTDISATLLMDPSYNAGLEHALDITSYWLKDIGWSLSNANPVLGSADISTSLVGPGGYKKGSDVNYSLTVTNNGPANAANVLVFATPPDTVTFKSSSTADCAGGFPCSLGPMASGSQKNFVVTFSVPASYANNGPIQLTVNAAAGLFDPAVQNNKASVSTPQAGGCSSAGLGEPIIPAALLLLGLGRRLRRSKSI
jgi:uncharacterized repeat protein (TIGR01451 family)